MVTLSTTLTTAVAALDIPMRAGLANGAALNAASEAESRSAARFWTALADHLETPDSGREAALSTAAADLPGDVRRNLIGTTCLSRNLVAQSAPVVAEFWSELFCLLSEVDSEQHATFRSIRNSFYSPCESTG